MGIPVTFPNSPLPITDLQNTSAEQMLAYFCQLMQNGTSGASVTTGPLLYPDPNSPGNTIASDLVLAVQQLHHRHLFLAIVAAGGAGGGGSSFQRVTDHAVNLGYGVYYSSNNQVSNGDSSNINKSGIIGVAQASVSAGSNVTIVTSGLVTGALSGAVAGTAYYMGHSGQPIVDASLVSGDRIILLGHAKNATDLEVRVQDVGLEP